jgi:hypothetical protein
MGIDSLIPDFIKLPLTLIIGGALIFSRLAPRYPQVAWLQKFRLPDNRTEEQKARARRSADFTAGIQMILMGLLLPFGYLMLSMMLLFSSPSTLGFVVVGGMSVVLIAMGIWAIAKSRS